MSNSKVTQDLLETDIILNLRQETRTSPELAPPLRTLTPRQRKESNKILEIVHLKDLETRPCLEGVILYSSSSQSTGHPKNIKLFPFYFRYPTTFGTVSLQKRING
ncbi:hypothetical protein TNCV_3779831 [Trichonephila clavipes]|nr:hypothetical protein TNCV_3779831 [Trichonephila clavipes]